MRYLLAEVLVVVEVDTDDVAVLAVSDHALALGAVAAGPAEDLPQHAAVLLAAQAVVGQTGIHAYLQPAAHSYLQSCLCSKPLLTSLLRSSSFEQVAYF